MSLFRADGKCEFIAEIGNAHDGSFDRAKRLLLAAKESGCDAAKLQCYSPSELVVLRGDGPAPAPWGDNGWTMRDLYTRAMTPREWFAPLYAYAKSIDLPIFSSVFGPESLALLESIGNPVYKIARLDNTQSTFIEKIKATGKPLIVSEEYHGESGDFPDYRLFCRAGYPQPTERMFSTEFDGGDWNHPLFDGFSYHGTDPLPCIVAATLGAKLIEAHMQLFSEPSELEADVSLTPRQFKEMIQTVRRIEEMMA